MCSFYCLFFAMFFAHFTSVEGEEMYQDLQFLFVHSNNSEVFEAFYFNESTRLFSHPMYNGDHTTILYGYGYTENFMRKSTQTIVDAYIRRCRHNILVIEWSKYSGGNYYFEAIPNARAVGDKVGQQLLKMRDIGFNLDNFHLVGHSLGGQLVGFIGRAVTKYSPTNYKMPKITALDPAGPLMYRVNGMLNKPLCAEDARAVLVIHTDSNFFGAPTSSGTIDFWPNGGKEQPGCPRVNWDVNNEDNFCSHRRSWMYYAESVRNVDHKTFLSVPCASWKDFQNNSCPENGTSTQTFMGVDSSTSFTGDYYLQTNPHPPFNRGERGIYFDESDEESF